MKNAESSLRVSVLEGGEVCKGRLLADTDPGRLKITVLEDGDLAQEYILRYMEEAEIMDKIDCMLTGTWQELRDVLEGQKELGVLPKVVFLDARVPFNQFHEPENLFPQSVSVVRDYFPDMEIVSISTSPDRALCKRAGIACIDKYKIADYLVEKGWVGV